MVDGQHLENKKMQHIHNHLADFDKVFHCQALKPHRCSCPNIYPCWKQACLWPWMTHCYSGHSGLRTVSNWLLVLCLTVAAPASQAFTQFIFSVCGMLTQGRHNKMFRSLEMIVSLNLNSRVLETCDLFHCWQLLQTLSVVTLFVS